MSLRAFLTLWYLCMAPHVAVAQQTLIYGSKPAMPDADALSRSALDSAHETQAAAHEKHAAEAAASAAESAALAAERDAQSAQAGVRAQTYLRRATRAAYQAQENQLRAQNAAQATRSLVGSLDKVAKSAANQAVAEVVRDALQKLSKEVQTTINAYNKGKEADFKRASEDAMESARPFQQGKWRAEKDTAEYVLRARELATAVTALKNESVKIAAGANKYQKEGNVVIAQQQMMRAHDLMDKALQMQAQAEGFQKTAQTINGNMGLYDLATGSAAAFAAHQANPSGAALPIPPPPAPLSLPSD
eukprot:GEMP01075107.1.p1 GENE.GEMP01075107.1~~GEMP01075107.1.p1  ORF type:complete len:304 (+),score=118.15 GEMP01075107.1:202-1113(+)